MNYLVQLLSISIAIILFLGMRYRLISLLIQKELYIENYSGNKVLTGGGLLILLPCLFAYMVFYLLKPTQDHVLYITMIIILALCGLLDDVLGDSSSKGLAGHFRNFLRGRMTTGMLKAFIGILLGFILAFSVNRHPVEVTVNVLLFSLSVNTINLFDLRPGRAVKTFGLLAVIVIILSGFTDIYLMLPVAVVLALYIGGEMEEIYMLGDTGANLLGGILGYYQVITLSLPAKIALVTLMILLHVFAEFKSISKYIEEVPILNKIDMLGRKRRR